MTTLNFQIYYYSSIKSKTIYMKDHEMLMPVSTDIWYQVKQVLLSSLSANSPDMSRIYISFSPFILGEDVWMAQNTNVK